MKENKRKEDLKKGRVRLKAWEEEKNFSAKEKSVSANLGKKSARNTISRKWKTEPTKHRLS